MTLAEKLLSLRTEKGLSQEDLAELMGVSRQSVSKWETDQSVPDLDRIIKLADLFGVTVDELVREGKRPQPPEPKVIYVERERKPERTWAQKIGIVLEGAGVGMIVVGFMGLGLLFLIGAALILLGLPLLLAKKHPFLIAGWLVVAGSLLVLNPYTSISPWGLWGGLIRLRIYLTTTNPERYVSYAIAAAVGIIRGTLSLALLFFTGRACRRAWKKRKEND